MIITQEMLPRKWSIHDPLAELPHGREILRSFDVLVNGEIVDRVRSYDCDRGVVRVVDIEATMLMDEPPDNSTEIQQCAERQIEGVVTLKLRRLGVSGKEIRGLGRPKSLRK